MGFGASAVSDVSSNSIRVLKVYKQTNVNTKLTYIECAREIVAKDGVVGLFGRGLTTKLISNGIQGAMFSVLWKTIEPMLFCGKGRGFLWLTEAGRSTLEHRRGAASGAPGGVSSGAAARLRERALCAASQSWRD